VSAARTLARRLVPRPVRNALRSPRKSLRRVADEMMHLAGADPVVPVHPGWAPRCHPAVARFARANQLADPEQARELHGFIAECRPDMVLFDVGAHFGLLTLAALHHGGPGARAVAVEPSPGAVRLLRVQARLNGCEERLRVVQACASDEAGVREMISVGVLGDGFFVFPGEEYPERELARTPAVTLDGLSAELGLHPTHVKIDVEGHEGAVLRGARGVLSRSPAPVLFLELHGDLLRGRGESPLDVLGQVTELGYALLSADGAPLDARAAAARPLARIIARRA